ncbi:ArfGap-domain-containing protein [Rhizodiscina lignyota]|uniref:ArfGap-domain-containing protein n=1 Tax=Rhizodiscina lignyota TaxID=1504668 RepID=A0A9P4IHK9_9PEZI|nr:ArfGap-domain-containing protein [Rhizodiscina lignyota]
MSNRRNPALDRAEQNRATLKSLVKLESNKSCADCKRNKHPRWASWNLGIFICIRCSGIHRGMGTHISRVKSVDLDSWTDEQLQSMLKWGNARANRYWEAKLAPGHVPSEAKIENFIRTKYESKRWVMDGGMPDPATLGSEGDDDVPLNVVQEKAKIERASSVRESAQGPIIRAPARPAANVDLIGGNDAPQRPSTTEPISRQPPAKASAAPPKQTRPGDSLLGLDFLGGTQSAPPERPSSTGNSSSAVPSRPDLKQSILSLYASAPRAAAPAQPQHHHHSSSGSFGGSFGGFQSPPMQSPPLQSPTQMNQNAAGGLNDAFSSLSFASPSSPPVQPQKPSPFANLTSAATARRQPSTASASSFGGGGSFFDTPAQKPAATSPPPQPTAAQRTFSQSSGFGDFFSATSPTAAPAPPKPSNPMSGGGDLFDLSMPSQPSAPAPVPKPTSPTMNSAFNLSQPAKPMQPPAPRQQAAPMASFSTADPWASGDVWGSSNTAAAAPAPKPSMPSNGISNDFGWGSSAAQKPTSPPQVTQDDDFGGWSSAPAPAQQQQQPPQKPSSGGLNNDDLFSNVWQ